MMMATAVHLPGSFPSNPKESEDIKVDENLGILRLNTQLAKSSPPETITPTTTLSQNSQDELFFDCPNPSHSSAIKDNGESSSRSYLSFQRVVQSVEDNEHTEWWKYQPPQELLEIQESTSPDIQAILELSIVRIRQRFEEEDEQRLASARPERPITRVGRASVKPQRVILATNEWLLTSDPNLLEAGQSSRLSAQSNASSVSTDSGYASVSPSSESAISPKAAGKRRFGLSALFGRKERKDLQFQRPEPWMSHSPAFKVIPPISAALSSVSPMSTAIAVAPAETSTVECVSCLDDFSPSVAVKLSCHSYCIDCFRRLVSTALDSETQWPVKCCLNPIPTNIIMPRLDREAITKYRKREAEWSIPVEERIFCSHGGCNHWIEPKFVNYKGSGAAYCAKCTGMTCVTCRGPSHGTDDCPQDAGLVATMDLAELEGWKRCYKCHAMVEHNEGCRHMTCRCNAEFCYICSARWRTCACTDAQLRILQRQVQQRREEAVVRTAAQEAAQAAADEENRIIIQMVADFERQEEERLMAELERARLEAEAERRMLEEQRQREEDERVAAVNLRFHQLNAELEILHDVQRVQIAERHEFDWETIQRDRENSLNNLSISHPAEALLLNTEFKTKISDAEYGFEQEYQVRYAEERRTEDAYVLQLRNFWKGKPEGEYKIRDSRDELRKDQERDYKVWDSYRRQQLKLLGEKEYERMRALVSKQSSEINAVDGRSQIEKMKLKRKRWAEGKWVMEVLKERVEMLQTLEQEEYAQEA